MSSYESIQKGFRVSKANVFAEKLLGAVMDPALSFIAQAA